MGLHYPKDRWTDLVRGIRSAIKEFGFEDVEEGISWLMSSKLKKEQIETLACHLTVGETYFFRDTKIFDALEKHILPELIWSRRKTDLRLRIWSAGSCTGEEPYSIAILLHRLIPDLDRWNITVLATDINPNFLEKAADGLYREWSFRGTPSWLKENYFSKKKGDFYEISSRIKKKVQFQYLNLVEDTYPSIYNDTNAMDIIFCRNVLMYFSQDQVQKVIDRFHKSLLDKSWLIVGSSEASHVFYRKYATANFPGAILYRKDDQLKKASQKCDNFIITDHSIPVHVSETTGQSFDFDKQKADITASEEQPIKSSPKSAVALYDEALLLYQKGEYEESINKMTHSLTVHENDDQMMTLLSKALANQGKLNNALVWCDKAINLNKLNPEYHQLRAVILQEQGHLEEAIKSLKNAIYLNPDFAVAYFLLGNLSRQQGKIKESNKYLTNVLTILRDRGNDEILPESEGLTTGRLRELIQLTIREESPA
jgi:chemotaxis protein methyltransferase CheR